MDTFQRCGKVVYFDKYMQVNNLKVTFAETSKDLSVYNNGVLKDQKPFVFKFCQRGSHPLLDLIWEPNFKSEQ